MIRPVQIEAIGHRNEKPPKSPVTLCIEQTSLEAVHSTLPVPSHSSQWQPPHQPQRHPRAAEASTDKVKVSFWGTAYQSGLGPSEPPSTPVRHGRLDPAQ